MAVCVRHFLTRHLVRVWLATSVDSWKRRFVASDSPLVHAAGTNPDRVLLAGDGAATGRGVHTHDLGLPGYLARSLSQHTARATDVDIVVTADMTARACIPALAAVNLARFDIILISIGSAEALDLMPVRAWRRSLTALLDDLDSRTPALTPILFLPIPVFGTNPALPRHLGRTIDDHVQTLNTVIDELVSARSRMSVVPVASANVFEPEGTHLYQRWAESISVPVSAQLDPSRLRADDTSAFDELERQQVLAKSGVLTRDDDPVLDGLTESARRAFGTTVAAVTFIESETQFMKSAVGIVPVTLPREEAFCDITIRRAAHFVVEDARLDPLYADYSVVAGDDAIRFYAGYPIEAPDGQRIGAVCIMDPEPRHFTPVDAQLLCTYAHTIQNHLWNDSTPARPSPVRRSSKD